jgi:hypothetical protein
LGPSNVPGSITWNRVAQHFHLQQTEAMWYTNWALLGY